MPTSSTNRKMTVSAAAHKVQKLAKLGVTASILPDGGGKFRIETSGAAPKKRKKVAAKKKAPKKAAKKKAAPRKKARRKAAKKKAARKR